MPPLNDARTPHYDADGLTSRTEIIALERAGRSSVVNPDWAFGAWRHRMRLERRLAAQGAGIHQVAFIRQDGAPICTCGLVGVAQPSVISAEALYGTLGHRTIPSLAGLAATFLVDGPWDTAGAWCATCGPLGGYTRRSQARARCRTHRCPTPES